MSNTTSAADPFGTRDTIQTARGPVGIYRLSRLEDQGVGAVSRLPYSMRILLEAVVRGCDGYVIRDEDVRHLANWSAADPAEYRDSVSAGARGVAGLHRACRPSWIWPPCGPP